MVVYTISKYVANWIGPRLLRGSLRARYRMRKQGDPSSSASPSSSPYTQLFFGLTLAQRLTGLVLYEALQKSGAHLKATSGIDDGEISASSRTKNEQVKARIRVLDNVLRPILTPNNKLEDLNIWRNDPYFLKWIREQLLLACYAPDVQEAMAAYPQLRSSPQLSRHAMHYRLLQLARGRLELTTRPKPLHERFLLPSSETLIRAFQMQGWAQTKAHVAPHTESSDESGGETTQSEGQEDISGASMLEIVDTATRGRGGSFVKHDLGPFHLVSEEANLYQWWTTEYVQGLGDYLISRQPDLVLDVGAGDGILLDHLRRYHQKILDNREAITRRSGRPRRGRSSHLLPKPTTTNAIEWIATDDGSWRIFAKAPVEQLSMMQALEHYVMGTEKKVIVLCSWMPMGQDWTQAFREAGVDEYILIGEADDGSCGHTTDTWGYGIEGTAVPAYRRDGYHRSNFDVLQAHQFSRFDTRRSKNGMTVSFRRD